MFFFFNDTATTEIYTLSLHDALPIYPLAVLLTEKQRALGAEHDLLERVEEVPRPDLSLLAPGREERGLVHEVSDRKSTRLNSSHANISYAVFCLKKKKIILLHTNLIT